MVAVNAGEWASTLKFVPMTTLIACDIANTWKYPEPYDFYDATADPDDYRELVSPAEWPAHFFQVQCDGASIGFFSGSPDGENCEISLGLHPTSTGGGRGLAFLRAGLAHLEPLLARDCQIVLSVAELNQRAITVYERAGFIVTRHFDQQTNGGVLPFVAMALSDSAVPTSRCHTYYLPSRT